MEIDETVISEDETKYDYHDPNGYKIRCGEKYIVLRDDYQGKVYYKIQVSKKNMNGDTEYAYKPVRFSNKEKDCDIQNKTIIRPLKFFEDFYYKSSDVNHFNPVFSLVIMDWEVLKSEQDLHKDALEDYNTTIEMDDLPF